MIFQKRKKRWQTQPVTMSYDAFGRMVQRQEPRAGSAPQTIEYEAVFGQPWRIVHGDSVTINEYHAADSAMAGRLKSRSVNGQVSRYDYLPNGALLRMWGAGTYPLRYEYDGFGRLWKLHTYRTEAGFDAAAWPGNPGDGDVEMGRENILAIGSRRRNAEVSIGKIIVQGNWLASSLAAGIADSTQDGFGQNDTLIPGGSARIIAKIAGITIKGTATGSTGAGDFFGLTAERIKKAKINGLALALTPNKDDLALDAANNDFRLVEV